MKTRPFLLTNDINITFVKFVSIVYNGDKHKSIAAEQVLQTKESVKV